MHISSRFWGFCAAFIVSAAALAQQSTNTVFIYSPDAGQGLHVAVQDVGGTWQHLGQLCSSDYGTWGAEKRMHHPSLCRADDGSWRLVFQVNDRSPLFAAAYSRDLVTWRPQDYPRVQTRNCLSPFVYLSGDGFDIVYRSNGAYYRVKGSADFRHFSAAEPVSSWSSQPVMHHVRIGGKSVEGQVFELSDQEMARVRQFFADRAEDNRLSSERMHDDKTRFSAIPSTVEASLSIDMSRQKPISDQLIGIFFEDISYAADGGLYAELIQNRDFEYGPKDRREWRATTAWHSPRPIEIATDQPLHPNNPHYALIASDTLWNEGWDGIAVTMGEAYDFSIFVRGTKQFTVQLVAANGLLLAQTKVKAQSADWKKYDAVLKVGRLPKADGQNDKAMKNSRLVIVPEGQQQAAIDMVSLFPQKTFKNRKNGLRRDLAETIAALQPKFVRFPGGCMSHGQGLENIYHWQHTVGPLWERKPDFNIWHYHQTRGLGFYEYFLFCEDIGAEPLPVLAAGVPCQNSANNAEGIGGQQGGIPMDEMPAYIQELLDMIDWANGDPATSPWARMRADAGHPAPFNLKYIGIGNEDIIGTVFEERYEMIARAIREKYPDIKVCGTVGPFHTPSADYIEGWDFTRRHPDLQYMVDEHYYESTGWFMHHRDYYDNYPQPSTLNPQPAKVYLGEWAASTNVKRPNLETALAEALYLTDIERNGDIVEMTSYAPMLCKDGHSNWNPDMIYFSNTTVRTTPAYEVQRLFSVNSGDRYVTSQLTIDQALRHRVGASLVIDSKTGRRYLKLINALPATLHLSLSGLQLPATVECQQFTGANVEDQHARTEVISTSSPTTLPPYSMRVITL